MKDIFKILFMNFFDFDKWIFIIAFINLCLFCYILFVKVIPIKRKMKKVIYPYETTAEYELKKISTEISETNINEFEKLRKKGTLAYSLFANIIAIFPLMGILGTVLSLIALISDSSDITGNFYSALTSTAWGIIFAMIFKICDAFIEPTIEESEKIFASLHNNTDEKAKK